jgi:hypothetical protein
VQLKKAGLNDASNAQALIQNARIAWQKYSAHLPDDAQSGVTQVNEGMRQLRVASAPATNAAAAGKSAKAALTPASQQAIHAAVAEIEAGIKQTASTLDC